MKSSSIIITALSVLTLAGIGSFFWQNSKVKEANAELAGKEEQLALLEQEVTHLRSTNGSLLESMADLSVVSKTGAESIKQSLENLGDQYDFIQDLTRKVQAKDSLNLALVMNLKRSLGNISDDDIKVEVRGGKVHVSIADRLLFSSGSARLGDQSQDILNKIALVLNDHNELDVMVEGHTDDVPIDGSCVKDNWDLSVRRATTVVRTLQDEYLVAPERLTAAGRGEYAPVAGNDSESGRQTNRRTEIVITPQLDQFFNLLESPALAN
ncbi:MAG: OmpA family protein [Bacteroidota bacterium]